MDMTEIECSIPGSYVIIDGERYDVPKPVVHLVMQRGRRNVALEQEIWTLKNDLIEAKRELKSRPN